MNEHDQSVLFGSGQCEWETPPELFDALDDVFNFDLDAAASYENHLCPVYFSLGGMNALDVNWWRLWCFPYDNYAYVHYNASSIFLNPPYGRGGNISGWMEKAVEMHYSPLAPKDGRIVLLLPNRTSESWFQLVSAHASMQLQIAGRLKFRLNGQEQNSAPFGSIVVVLGPVPSDEKMQQLSKLGLLQISYR